jgi:predicted nucleic acid-binding protein
MAEAGEVRSDRDALPGPVVSNTTPLIMLVGIGRLELLHAVYGLVPSVRPVIEEMRSQGRYISRSLEARILDAAGEGQREGRGTHGD